MNRWPAPARRFPTTTAYICLHVDATWSRTKHTPERCVRVCVCVAMAVATGCNLFPEAVSLCLLLHCGSVCPPLLTEMTSKHSREHACTFAVVHLISSFGDTWKKVALFFQSQRCTTNRVSAHSERVSPFPTSPQGPSVPAQILWMQGVMLPPVTEYLKSQSPPPNGLPHVSWSRRVWPSEIFSLKTGVLPKFQGKRQVSLLSLLWQGITNMSAPAFVNLPVVI